MAPAPAVERKRRRESLREILNVMRAPFGPVRAYATPASPDLERIDDGSITGFADQALLAARHCALARCRFGRMLINSALRAAPALCRGPLAIWNAGHVASWLLRHSKRCS